MAGLIDTTTGLDFGSGLQFQTPIGGPGLTINVQSAPSWVIVAGGVAASLDLDFVNNQSWVNGASSTPGAVLTTTRAQSAYYTSSLGVLSLFSANTLRLGDLGALVEEARTNLCIQSQAFSNAAWTASQVTVPVTTGTAPDGTATACTLTDNTNSTGHSLTGTAFSTTNATTYTMSLFVRAGTDTKFQLTFVSGGGGAFSGLGYANFDVGLGVVTATGGTLAGYGIVPLGTTGWYRCWIAAAATATTNTGAMLINRIATGADTRSPTYAGSSTTLSIWGAQVEAGAFPSSYIPTTASSATRDADVVQMTLPAALQSLGAYSMYAAGACGAPASNSLNQTIASLNSAANANRIQFYRAASTGNPTVIQSSGGVAQFNAAIGSPSWANGASAKLAMGADVSGQQGAYNGTADSNSYAGTMPASISRLNVGCDAVSTSQWNGYIQRIAVWNSRVTAANFATTTTITAPSWVQTAGGTTASIDLDIGNNRSWMSLGQQISLPALLSVTRASSAYYTDSTGRMTLFGSGIMRQGDLGALIEESRTNVTINSQSPASWGQANASSTNNFAVAPDGSSTAGKIQEDSATNLHFAYNGNPIQTGNTVCSIYAKSGSFDRNVMFLFANGANGRYCIVNPLTGVVVQDNQVFGTGGTVTSITTSVVALANGWYRIIVVIAATGTNQYSCGLANGTTISYAGNGSSYNLYWGAQSEQGATFPTSYIPTTSTSATRAADNVTLTLPTAAQGLSAYSLWVSANPQTPTSNSSLQIPACLSNGATTNRIRLYRQGTNALPTIQTTSGGSGQILAVVGGGSAWPQSTNRTFAFGGDGSGQQAAYNGAADSNSYATTMPVSVNRLSVGCDEAGTGSQWNGYIPHITVYNTRISAANLAAIADTPPGWVLAIGTTQANVDIDFANNRVWNGAYNATIPSVVSCTRASSAYYTTSAGVLQLFSSNTLRYGDLGALIEEARTNVATQSQFASGYTVRNTTLTTNATTAPDGTSTAAKLAYNATGTGQKSIEGPSASLASGTTYVVSCFMKAAEYQYGAMNCFTGVSDFGVTFDLVGLSVVGNRSGGGAIVASGVIPLGNGWVRCWFSFTSNGTSTTTACQVFVGSSAFTNYGATGAGTVGSGIYIWGYQMEAGSFPTSYIPTTASSATRAADAVTISSSLITPAATIYSESGATAGGTLPRHYILNDGTNQSQTFLSGTQYAVQSAVGSTAVNSNSAAKVAARYATNNLNVAANGQVGIAATTATLIGTPSFIYIGNQAALNRAFNGNIKRLASFNNVAANDTALQALTA